MKRLVLAAIVAMFVTPAAATAALPPAMCLPNAVDTPVLSVHETTFDACKAGYKTVFVLSGTEIEHFHYNAKGIDEQPTWEIAAANLRLLRGASQPNGNLVIDPSPGTISSAESLDVGNSNSMKGSPGDVVFGQSNEATVGVASVLGGSSNVASGSQSVVVGGLGGKASAQRAVVLGGRNNTASGVESVVCGGSEQSATELLQNLC